MSNKIGFWAVLSIVIGSQIGSGVFMLPAGLAPYGAFSMVGWVFSGIGAISLGLVFALLCGRFPETGGPHNYVEKAFGPHLSFFTGWTYWILSWVTTPAVLVTCVGYLSAFFPTQDKSFYLAIELFLLFAITLLNTRGITAAGHAEFVLTLLKFIPLVVIPLCGIYYFDLDNFVQAQQVLDRPLSGKLAQVTLLTLWGFIGLECATAPAGSVENAKKVIPKAIVIGTSCVALVYFLNCVGIMGLMPGSELALAKAPYVDATQRIFGGHWHLVISLIAAIICLGTLNAWVLTSGQIILGFAEDGYVSSFFAKRNKHDAPHVGLIVSSLGVVPLLFLIADQSLAQQITTIIDIAVVAFLFVYLICALSLLKLSSGSLKAIIPSVIGAVFCLWIIYETPLYTLMISGLVAMSGVPFYLWWFFRSRGKAKITLAKS
ncbi:MAG: amino acid permease [Alphaproteobacteria bacterium]|jgi:APA family basic amino acid/polyamine antiporter|nr:amino acid permease [Alphaproteobacteria bacterium]MBP9877726.1 amino acid permease [Alphaproteobacteria bacterium]